MSRISCYILFELLTVFTVTLTALTSLVVVGGIASEAMQQGLGPVAIIQLVPFILPEALRFSVPGTILFAVCSVYGRMSADNEIVAVKALGVTPLKMILPALGLAFVLSVGTVWLNDVAVSWGRQGVNRVVIQSVEEITYGMLRTHRSYSTQKMSINVREVDGKRLIRPMLIAYGEEGETPMTITAQEAVLRSDLEKQVLIITLRNGVVKFRDRASLRFNDFVHEIPLHHVAKKADRRDKPSNYPLNQIAAEIKQQQTQIQQIRRTQATRAAFQMISGDFHALTSSQWTLRAHKLKEAEERKSQLQTVPWRRWANGFSCLCFVLVGAPLAIWRRNADVWTSFFYCFMPILIIYYPLMVLGVDQAKSGDWPPYCVWMGNLLLVVIGLAMMQKVRRY